MSMTDKKIYDSEFEAWKWVHEMFPDKKWYHDNESSRAAGYEIYRDLEEYYNYICCLGDRLEVNIEEGNQTINLWIKGDSDAEESKCCEAYTSYDISHTELSEICDALYMCANAFASNDIQTRSFKNIDDIIYKLNLIKKLREGWEN